MKVKRPKNRQEAQELVRQIQAFQREESGKSLRLDINRAYWQETNNSREKMQEFT